MSQVKEWNRRKTPITKTSIGKYCGSERPPLIASTQDTIAINFISDYSYAMNGFRLEWRVNGMQHKNH